jgi:hypothetical protein
VSSLLQLAVVTRELAARNVAYNAVCLFHKVFEGFNAKDIGLDWLRKVLYKHLVEDWRDVHCVDVQSGLAYGMTMLPAGMT